MFAIIKGLPYLIHDGMAYPVSIKQNGDYSYSEQQAFKTDLKGTYAMFEILAKCKVLCSIRRSRKKKEE